MARARILWLDFPHFLHTKTKRLGLAVFGQTEFREEGFRQRSSATFTEDGLYHTREDEEKTRLGESMKPGGHEVPFLL